MKLIVATTPTFFVEEDKIITELFEAGLDVLHLRKPETSAMYAERLLTLIPQKYHRRIVTHEHFYLQQEFNLMGVHLNDRNRNEPDEFDGHVSCDCHTLEELQAKKRYYDYIVLSPVYDCTIAGSVQEAGFSPEELRQASKRHIIDSKVVALGGVTADNIREVKKLGFGGAMVMNDLWDKFDPCNDCNYMEVIHHFKRLKKLVD